MQRLALLTVLAFSRLPAQQATPFPDAAAIMARVAANQDASEAQRAHFTYVQHARASSRKGSSVRCEEITDTRITPTPTGSSRQLLKLQGKLLVKGKYVAYDHFPEPKKAATASASASGDNVKPDHDDLSISTGDDTDPMDRDLVENMRENLTANEKDSKDGISHKLFPLTSAEQAGYLFRFVGRETTNGRTVFHIAFTPKDKEDFGWKGDAYIDTEVFQPVLVRTAMARKIPFAVRTLLGTNLPGLGFTVIYAPEPSDKPGAVWFPVSFGTEFKLRVLFFLSRDITISAENRSFEMTHVTSTILPSQ